MPCIRMIIEALISIGNWTPKDEFVWGNKNLVSLEPEYSRLARNGYLRVCDFVDADGRIREAREINLSFAQRLEWVRVTAAIRKTFTSASLVHEETRENDVTSFRWAVGEKRIEKTELDTKNVARALFSLPLGNDPSRTRSKFDREIGATTDTVCCMKTICAHSNIPRIRSFYIRFINAFAWSNKQYFRFKRIDSPKCHGCNTPVQERVHLFFECVTTIRFYCTIFGVGNYNVKGSVQKWLAQREDPGKAHIIGFCIYFCYRENLRKAPPNAEAFFIWLEKIRKIELVIAEKRDKIAQHTEKWNDIELALL